MTNIGMRAFCQMETGFTRQISYLEPLAYQLSRSSSPEEKLLILNKENRVKSFSFSPLPFFFSLSLQEQCALKQLVAIEEICSLKEGEVSLFQLKDFLSHMVLLDDFYREFGGIVGYQLEVYRQLQGSKHEEIRAYFPPDSIDISNAEHSHTKKVIKDGIQWLPRLCEIYPLGGAADRLHLLEEKTDRELPAAKLEFAGKSLLAGLFADLEAREHLYYKLYGRQLITPVAMMSSFEKDNWLHVQQILEENQWFGRPKNSIRLFTQPLVPVVNSQGRWHWKEPWKLFLKPGGHGVIWKLAKDCGVFDWFRSLKREYALVRQINNPLAGIDYGLLAFTGIGSSRKKIFGFASCPRMSERAEGVNVLLERKGDSKVSYAISNVEYCDLRQSQVLCVSDKLGFSANTNILFAQLDAIERAVEECPLPGLLIHFKKTEGGESLGRLESTMQNIAEVFTEESPDLLQTFITHNVRHKTISTTKKAYVPSGSLAETPEHCFYDLMYAHRELLSEYCGYTLPPLDSLAHQLSSHPSFVFLYHPALGPLYSLICQKLRGGTLAFGSELRLDIADVLLEDLFVKGSLRIFAKEPLGRVKAGALAFSEERGRCSLSNVRISNRGVNWVESAPFWRSKYQYRESVEVILEGNSLFIAENLKLKGSHRFVVKDGEKMVVFEKKGEIRKERSKI